MEGKEGEHVTLTSSDLLARIQALEERRSRSSARPDPRIDDLQEKVNVLEARTRTTQAKKIRDLEQRMSETRKKLRRNNASRDIGIEDDDSVFEEERTFPDNTFSFLLLVKYPFCERKKAEHEIEIEEADRLSGKTSSDYMCLPFWLALSILVIQLAIYSLALQNAADFGNPANPFQFPINVDPYTRTVESTEVVDLLLDFTAMEFVAALDDAAFALSLRGFLGRSMKKTARTVKTARYTQRDKRTWLRKWPMLVVAIVLITCYVIVRVKQNNRAFGDNEIVMQMQDDAIPWLSTLSGTYIGCTLFRSDRRKLDVGPIIYSKHPANGCDENWKKEQATFFFCEGKHWVFAVGDEMKSPCRTWTMKSYKADAANADAYDIVSHSAAS
eukprot:scaffold5889_cov115-Cylindrotheca_fusiformis.AAC.1